MIFISYATKDTPYIKVIETHLLPTLKKFKLKYYISYIKDRGSWSLNTAIKSEFIKEMLLKYKEDICFLDADATIERYPKLLFHIPDEFDIALHLLDWQLMWRDKIGEKQRELLSGTMVLKYNERTINLLNEWVAQVKKKPNIKEQKVLENFLLNDSKYKLFELPANYCTIKKFDGSIPEYVGEPIILHHQVSREYKNRRR